MANWSLSGRTALITGGARGIGLETGRRLAARGMTVALVDLDEDAAEESARTLGGPGAMGLAADVTDRDAIEAAVAATVERFGGIDVCVANAGVSGEVTSVLASDLEAVERTIEVDLLGVLRTVKAALPHVVERQGYVLSVASLYAFFNPVLAAPYAMSKAGVEQLGRALRAELRPHGASAGVAYFGIIDTDMVRSVFAEGSVAQGLRSAAPGWLGRSLPVGRAADAMCRGVERRSPRVSAPRWLPAALALRGPLAFLDDRLTGDDTTIGAIRQAEALSAERAGLGPNSLANSAGRRGP